MGKDWEVYIWSSTTCLRRTFYNKIILFKSPILAPYPEPYPVPEKLKNLPGKLIYFSLGSMASVYRPLMHKMLEILAKLPHRFIISTGMIGDEYAMAENMHVSQTFCYQLEL